MFNGELIKGVKDICNHIVGNWYSLDKKQLLIFSFCDQLLKKAEIVIIDAEKNPVKSLYSVGIHVSVIFNPINEYYIDIGKYEKEKYLIKELNPQVLRLQD